MWVLWVFDASNLSFLREDHFDNPMQCGSLRLNPGLGIDLKRAPAVGEVFVVEAKHVPPLETLV